MPKGTSFHNNGVQTGGSGRSGAAPLAPIPGLTAPSAPADATRVAPPVGIAPMPPAKPVYSGQPASVFNDIKGDEGKMYDHLQSNAPDARNWRQENPGANVAMQDARRKSDAAFRKNVTDNPLDYPKSVRDSVARVENNITEVKDIFKETKEMLDSGDVPTNDPRKKNLAPRDVR